jgi:hypothetical protein
MNESHKAPADHPAPHPNGSPAGALFTFIQSVDMPHPEKEGVHLAGGVSSDPTRGNSGDVGFSSSFSLPLLFQIPGFHFQIPVFEFLGSAF